MITDLQQLLKSRVPELAGLVLLLMLGTFGWLAAEYQNQIFWVQHTLEVEKKIDQVYASVLETETGQRGYLLTGSNSFLEPYDAARTALPQNIVNLKRLTDDNADQQRMTSELFPLIDERLRLLKRRIEDYRAGKTDLTGLARGKEVMEQIRQKIADMRDLESRLLETRNARSRSYMRGAAFAALLTALFSILTAGAWMITSRRTNRELVTANRDLMRAIADREAGDEKVRQMQKMEAVGQLTGGIAHDFNNMLAVVLGALGLVKRRLDKGDMNIQSLIDGAIDGADRAAALTKRLLAFSRQQPLAPQAIAVNKLVSGMSDMIVRTLGEMIKTETVLAGGLWNIHADPPLLENALLNLCVNARDAMPDGGRLTIETANTHLDDGYAGAHEEVTAGQYVMIAVSDTGTGMAPEVIRKAFDPFFTTKGTGKGTGLGLSQVHGFVKQSGGHIKIYSEPGSGTTVKMYFPRFFPTAEEPTTPSQGGPAQRARKGETGELILVVEDDERVREVSVTMLRDLGYTTLHADCASAALRQIDQYPNIVLMFTDIVMPDVNGRKLADEAVKRRPDLKVLFTTGFTKNAVIHNGVLDAGVQLLQKPFTVDQLASKVRSILDAGSSGGMS